MLEILVKVSRISISRRLISNSRMERFDFLLERAFSITWKSNESSVWIYHFSITYFPKELIRRILIYQASSTEILF